MGVCRGDIGGERALGREEAKQSKEPLLGDLGRRGDSPPTLPRLPLKSSLEGLERPLGGGVPLQRPLPLLLGLLLGLARVSRSTEEGLVGMWWLLARVGSI